MTIEMLYSKIHRARVTDANLNYVGSITIDSFLAKEAGLLENMKVEVLNVNNGERFSTYVILGEANSGVICLNGAAARKVQKDDIVIIVAYAHVKEEDLKAHKPKIILVDENNKIKR